MLTTYSHHFALSAGAIITMKAFLLAIFLVVLLSLIGLGLLAARHVRAHY